MAIWRVEVNEKPGIYDPLGESVHKDLLDLGIKTVKTVRVIQVYTIKGGISPAEITRIAADLLTDSVTQEFSVVQLPAANSTSQNSQARVVEIAYNPGVMDPVEESTIKGVRDLGISQVQWVRTSRKYILSGKCSVRDVALIADKVLSNKLIQHVVRDSLALPVEPKVKVIPDKITVLTVDLLSATDPELKTLSQKGQLFLNLAEMRSIQKYFRKLKRNPTDCELETIAQTWSEHCHHKTFRGKIRYESTVSGKKTTRTVNNLLKSTIIKATHEVNKPWCVSVFHDNAGVIEFDEESNVCFKVETHNHPSALEPFGGANTGVGGVIRDTLGTGLGAKPICNTDIFCFAPPDFDSKNLPAGSLHPKRVMKGVVSGVRDYGNKMGIPTVNGAILFDERFVGNPLVYCGNVGIIPRGMEHKKVFQGDLIVTVGGHTGRDGIHGATFSSGELTHESEDVSSGAVQIGNPIQEKKVLDCLLVARDRGLYTAITDCGAGGFSSAVGEMGSVLGARVDLDKAPLKYQGLSYMEIWISESQERMVMSVSPTKIDELIAVFAAENVEATVIGEFTGTGRLELFFHGEKVCDLDMNFMHEGIPDITKEACWAEPKGKDPRIACPTDLTEKLLESLSHYNVCSKHWVIRQYDHEVQGGTVIKPLVGPATNGPSDASVITPKLGSAKAIAISNGINVRFGMIDPFWMAASCIDEALRQIIAVGGNMERVALLDNFCWGNPDKPDRLGGLVRCAEGCYKTAVGFGVPFISGKDSLYNEFTQGKKTIAIPGTILISAMGIIDDVNRCVTMDLKRAGNLIYIVGETKEELGGSIYWDTFGQLGRSVPEVDTKKSLKLFGTLACAIQNGLVASAHDCSEGGLAVALSEMAFTAGLGITAMLKNVPYQGKVRRNDFVLFSESNARLVVEVKPENEAVFLKAMAGVSLGHIGKVEASPEFVVYGLNDRVCLNAYIKNLQAAWQRPLDW